MVIFYLFFFSKFGISLKLIQVSRIHLNIYNNIPLIFGHYPCIPKNPSRASVLQHSFAIKTFVLSIFDWPLNTRFTVVIFSSCQNILCQGTVIMTSFCVQDRRENDLENFNIQIRFDVHVFD